MLEMKNDQFGDGSNKELIQSALEKMPNFSTEIQTNNVLTKRILALKVKDGLHIDMQEAEREMQKNMQKLKLADAEESVESIVQRVT